MWHNIIMHRLYKNKSADIEAERCKRKSCGSCRGEDSRYSLLSSGG
jgi:hypothetical protein